MSERESMSAAEFRALQGKPKVKKKRRKQRQFQEIDTRRTKRHCAECDARLHAVVLALRANTEHQATHDVDTVPGSGAASSHGSRG